MLFVLGIAGFVMLIAIIWCIRTMKRGFTPLSKNQELWRAKFQEDEQRLAKEQQEISESEQLHFLEAAIKDLINLDKIDNLTCERDKNNIIVHSNTDEWILSYHAVEQKLHTVKKVLHGKSHWILKTKDKSYDFSTIDALMRAFGACLKGEDPELLEPKSFLPRQHHNRKAHKPSRMKL
ncbi:MAG: hypothetical protein IJU79_07400 [Desulfovibrionaceae bacterium]|nr:hypothetical protein [Desulfovibrionaceae bacterium]